MKTHFISKKNSKTLIYLNEIMSTPKSHMDPKI